MGAHAARNPERERTLRAKAVKSLRELREYYSEVNWAQGILNVGKAISLLEWLKQI